MSRDERDTIFARMAWSKNSEAYKDYYSKNPSLKDEDDELRALPPICGEGTATYDPINAPIADAVFQFLGDIRHLASGAANTQKTVVDSKLITKRLKGLAKKYGALSVGIISMKPEYYYSFRGRWSENYGDVVDEKDKPYGIVFTVEMDKDMINRGPQLAEVIETSHGYVKAAIIGMVLAYYIRALGYEARNHMDSNYLLGVKSPAELAGLGEIGRSGLLITPENGSAVRIGVVTTSLPLEVDKPQNFGIKEFCEICNRCARNCPAQAISREHSRQTEQGAKWDFSQTSCYRLWRHVGTDCGICISSCPFVNGLKVDKVKESVGDEDKMKALLKEYEQQFGVQRPYIKTPPEWLL
ncbi:4Fe-4S dicluster domain-containing protein [Clostridium sp. 'deep sea']|uniref:4Fe-4S dicluster domain-containing protein n=1 Tax=Clostridium sp. 'deep sea' TaxID=2779445 RepID=UPI00189687E7|nr:reductive dehalogenase domain-containing protein [Clostridium sp. 'deep sea']QOR36255.1 4Fe-4S dicluster domain-containing protein [Clostridium sp. 'deep sea']